MHREEMEMEMEMNGIGTERDATAAADDVPKVDYKGWRAMPFIIGNETFERLGAIGTLANLLIYLTQRFNLKSITATNMVNIFNGTANFSTLLGAFLCDTYFGRFKTLAFATLASYLGLQAIQLTAAVDKLHPPPCGSQSVCVEPTRGQVAFLITAFALLVTGAAGIRPCNLAFGADQFNPHTESGRRGVNSFINWYVCNYTLAVMVSLTVVVYIQTNISWTIGLAIPAALMLVSCVVYFMGSHMYVKVKATGSPITSLLQVIVAAIRKRRLDHPEHPAVSLYDHVPAKSINFKLPYTDQLRFLDKAAIVAPGDKLNADGSPVEPWRLCGMQQVEEVKCVARIIPIWIAGMIYLIAIIQQQTYAIFQATQADRRLGNGNFKVPPASYIIFLMLSITIFVPIYDRVIVPSLRRATGKEGGITILRRIGIGFVIAILATIVSAFVEERRRTIALSRPPVGYEPRRGAISSMSAFWLVPQLSLAGLAEAFATIGLLEFYYKQFPENMKSIAGSIFCCGFAGASYMSSLLISIVHHSTGKSGNGNWLPEDLNKGRLDYFYYLVATIGVLNLGYFLMCSSWYKYKGELDTAMEYPKENRPEKTAV